VTMVRIDVSVVDILRRRGVAQGCRAPSLSVAHGAVRVLR
jgi:hypothetical protein